MPPIHAIFFDIGDTLVYDHPPLRERLAIAARSSGLRLEDKHLPAAFRVGEAYAVERYVQGVPWDDYNALRESLRRVLWALCLPPLDEAGWVSLVQTFAGIPFERCAHPEAIALLAELKQRGFLVGAISDWETTLPDLLTELGLAPYFDVVAVSATFGVTKPNPRLFQEALRQANAAPETSLHVGDWYELDVCGARAAGMQTLLFDWPGRCPDADCPRVTTFAELFAYLLALPCPK